jgi:hypothetical protein
MVYSPLQKVSFIMFLPEEAFIPFTFTENVILVIQIVFNVTNSILQLLLLFCWWKLRRTDADRFAIVIIISDLTYAIFMIVVGMSSVLGGGLWWKQPSLGPIRCVIDGTIALICSWGCINAIVLYTIQRYMMICRNSSVPMTACALTLLYITLVPIAFCTIITYSSDAKLNIASSGVYCTIDWDDHSVTSHSITAITIGIYLMNHYLIFWSYYSIYKHLGHVFFNSITMNTQNQTDAEEKVEHETIQRTALIRSILIVTAYLVAWGPFNVLVLYEFISKRPAAPLFDAVCVFFLHINPLLNFLIFFHTNSHYKQAIKDLFRFSETMKNMNVMCCGCICKLVT